MTMHIEMSDLTTCETWHDRADAIGQALIAAPLGTGDLGLGVEIIIGGRRYLCRQWTIDRNEKLRATWVLRSELMRRCQIPLSLLIHLPWRTALAVIRRRMVKIR